MNNNNLDQTPRYICLLAAILTLLLFSTFSHAYSVGLESYRSLNPTVNIAVPYKLKNADKISPYGPGMDYELLELFLQRHNYKVRRVYAESYDEAMRLLQRNGVDLMIGFGSETSFEMEQIKRSPALTEFYPVMVVLPKDGNKLKNLDLSNIHFNKLGFSESQLSAAEEKNSNAILLEPSIYSLIMPMNTALSTAGHLAEKTGYYWYWNSANLILDEQMQSFWAEPSVKSAMSELGERYYGFLPKKPKQEQLHEISRAIRENMSSYQANIIKAAEENNIDPLLISAVIFQESRFDPSALSHTGVRGIMQLTLPTANMLGVDRMNPEEAIMGGARYLRSIYDSLEFAEGMSDWDKWCMALAGFNQGPTVMRRAVKAAGNEGLELTWASMRKYYPSLYAKGLANSGFRAKEAVNYVENVRYYYFVLSGLASVGWLEQENLTGFLASAE